ncbi:MAG TPA: hypothetical protein VMX13_12745 [Sedimentisphaerales bacterium]|nr:hypothetical protein [Sedimentisphaerales bacterium]
MDFDSYFLIWLPFVALTPAERWKAAGRQFQTSFVTERWFIVAAVIVLIALTLLLVAVSVQKRTRERKGPGLLFFECAERRGLSARECSALLEVAKRAGIRRSEDVFTDDVAFYRGAAKLMEEGAARGRTGGDSESLTTVLFFLREKLAFQKQTALFAGAPVKSKKLSSRQIPVGRKVNITCRAAKDSDDIEAIVMHNDEKELTIKSAVPVKITFGELWRVRYCFGASIWEFDTTIAACNGDILAFNHSDSIRFINRRRFLRVPVREPALVARFPFSKMLFADAGGTGNHPGPSPGMSEAPGTLWGPPEFVPAVVTELAGPGLRIEAPLEVKVQERVLVVMKLGEDHGWDAVSPRRHGDGRSGALRIVEDIGEVRHIRAVQNGFSIAVELIGLSDSDINELIRATNMASLKGATESQAAPNSVQNRQQAPQPVSVHGV